MLYGKWGECLVYCTIFRVAGCVIWQMGECLVYFTIFRVAGCVIIMANGGVSRLLYNK